MDVLLRWAWEWPRSWFHFGVQVFTQVCSLERSCSSWAEKQEPGWAILQCWAAGVCFPHLIPAGNSRNVGGDGAARPHPLTTPGVLIPDTLWRLWAAWQEIQRGRAGDQVPYPQLPHSNGEVVVLVQVVFLLSPAPGTSSSGRAPLERGGTSSRLTLGWPGLTRGLFPDSVHRRGEFGCSLATGKAGWASTPPSCTVSSLSLGRVSAGGVLVISETGEGAGGEKSLRFSFSLVFQCS